jgi:uncharacterized membrane protein SpoIIM required for sporulation
LISTHWLERRKLHWQRLEQLLDESARNGFRNLGRSDLRELGLLYRQIAADLAALREDPGSVHFARYLNRLLARAHNIIYSAHKTSPSMILEFFWTSYPRAFRRNWNYVLAAVLIFAAGALLGAGLTFQDPDFKLSILGPQMVQTIEKREMWTHSIVGMKPLASSAIMTNNISVTFMIFALGITAGIGTLYMIAFNGLLMGVIGMACHLSGMSLQLWGFVAPHGVLELPAIFIAGGAGLRVAAGLLFPGYLPRRESLVRAGSEAVRLLLGSIPILVMAGILEGFVSPTSLALHLKFGLAAALFALLLLYLFTIRKEPAEKDAASRLSTTRHL